MTIPVLDGAVAPVSISHNIPNSAVTWSLAAPWHDPSNTFRAVSPLQMAYVVPFTGSESYFYEIGVTSSAVPLFHTVQNNTVSNALQVNLVLPKFLTTDASRSFVLPASDPTATANPWARYTFKISFDEKSTLANFLPGVFLDTVKYDVYPINIHGPVFVSTLAPIPPDPNAGPGLAATGSVTGSPEIIYIEVPVFIPPPPSVPDDGKLRWLDGTTGETKLGSPPEGWTIQADGAAYPPPVVGDGDGDSDDPGGAGSSTSPTAPQEQLLLDAIKDVPLLNPKSTRWAFTFKPTDYVQGGLGIQNCNHVINTFAADAGPTRGDFKIQNWVTEFFSTTAGLFGGTKFNHNDPTILAYIEIVDKAVVRMLTGTPESIQPDGATDFISKNVNEVVRLGYPAFLQQGKWNTPTLIPIELDAVQHHYHTLGLDINVIVFCTITAIAISRIVTDKGVWK